MRFAKSFIIAVFIMSAGRQSHATTSMVGASLKGLKTPGSLGILVGIQYLHNLNENFGVGGAVHTGQISEGASGSFSYGGLVANYSSSVGETTRMDMSLLMGGGGGFTAAGGVGGGIALEPTASLSFKFGQTRTTLGAGFLWLPNNSAFTGITAFARFDFESGGE